MSGEHQPWWASATEVEHLDAVDPVEAFRASRRPAGWRPEDASTDEERSGGSGAEATGSDQGPTHGRRAAAAPEEDPAEAGEGPDRSSQGPTTGGHHRPELCGICPLCTLARTLEETRPELLDHLTEAARHLSAAARALLEPPPDRRAEGDEAGPTAQSSRSRRPGSGVERIPLDQDPGPRPPGASTDTTQERGDG